jgi:hypothetical protein
VPDCLPPLRKLVQDSGTRRSISLIPAENKLTPRKALNISPKLLIIVAVLVVVLVVAVYGLTVLFTQTVPSATVKGPSGSPSAVGDCSTLTISPNSLTLSASNPTQGVMNVTCSNSPAFTVTSEGLFTAVLPNGPYGCVSSISCFSGYTSLTVFNYTSWQTQGCGSYSYSANGYHVPTSGTFLSLTKGDYVYCLGYYLQPYSTSSPTSLASFTITWNTP